MYSKQLQLLNVVLEATQSQQAVWVREGALYHTRFGELKCSIRFKHPLLAGDDGSDADAAEVSVGQTVFTFYSGTEGFDLVARVLGAAYPDIRKHNQAWESRLDQAIDQIRKGS